VDPGKGSRLVEEIRSLNPQLKAFAFLNRAGPREVDNQEAGDYLADNEALSFLTGSSRDKPVRKLLVETAHYIQAGQGCLKNECF
jgi:hypothetical protein